MVRHNVASSVGGFVEESHRYRGLYDDQFFYVKVGLEVPVLAADRLLCKYRQHPEATTHVEYEAGRHTSARLHWLSWIGDYLFEHEIEDVGIWKLLHEEQSRTYSRRVRKLERALAQERRKKRQLRMSNRHLKKSERSSKEERGRYSAKERNQRSVPQRQYMNGHALNGLSDKAWKLLRRVVGYLRSKASSR
jgi:hypothetical protein